MGDPEAGFRWREFHIPPLTPRWHCPLALLLFLTLVCLFTQRTDSSSRQSASSSSGPPFLEMLWHFSLSVSNLLWVGARLTSSLRCSPEESSAILCFHLPGEGLLVLESFSRKQVPAGSENSPLASTLLARLQSPAPSGPRPAFPHREGWPRPMGHTAIQQQALPVWWLSTWTGDTGHHVAGARPQRLLHPLHSHRSRLELGASACWANPNLPEDLGGFGSGWRLRGLVNVKER